MAKRDMIDDLVDILYPWPGAEDVPDGDEDILDAARDEVAGEREKFEQNLRLTEENADWEFDPLLAEINTARREMRAAEARMRMLVAYGREFIKPQPYQLKDLAGATGMSISGTRSSYTVEEIAAVARRIGRQPRSRDEEFWATFNKEDAATRLPGIAAVAEAMGRQPRGGAGKTGE
ncbi:hypothetical protein [Amycolatopsis sp. A1MSW2902]|uniref:hypothetical protein n=1 Tax=Amycolatopsis sp. A1MSW2902 TaxID=687413 RepID=UPI00307D7608